MSRVFHVCHDCHTPDITADRREDFGGIRLCRSCHVDRRRVTPSIVDLPLNLDQLVRFSPRALAFAR